MLWQKAGTAYMVVRAVRLLAARGWLPGDSGLTVRDVHVHHRVHGGILVLAQHLAGSGRGRCVHTPWRANLLCTGLALIVDEFDVLLGADDSRWVRCSRSALDAMAALGAVLGVGDWRWAFDRNG